MPYKFGNQQPQRFRRGHTRRQERRRAAGGSLLAAAAVTMQAVREEVRRVVRLAAVRKITQLSPEALEAASNRALRAAFRHVPQTELAALDR